MLSCPLLLLPAPSTQRTDPLLPVSLRGFGKQLLWFADSLETLSPQCSGEARGAEETSVETDMETAPVDCSQRGRGCEFLEEFLFSCTGLKMKV